MTGSRLFFPLRTSVELFRDPAAPSAHLRAKVGAVLFDELVFETGIYDASITADGSWANERVADGLTDEELGATRSLVEEGSPFTLSIGREPAFGVPAPPEAMHTFIAAPLTAHFVAEWESVLRALADFEPDWASGFQINGTRLARSPVGEEISRRNFECLGNRDLLPDDHTFLRKWTYEAFNRDVVVAGDLGATVNMTPRFLPLFNAAGYGAASVGEHSLEILVPNLELVSWENVVAFREHAGCLEARAKLRDFEQRALNSDPNSAGAFQAKLAQEIAADLQQAVADARPRLGLELVRQVITSAVATVLPVVGPVVGGVDAARHARAYNRSWGAAIMRLSR